MKSIGVSNQWRACVLGALNGLMIGVIASTIIRIYTDYEAINILREIPNDPMLAHFLRTVDPIWYGVITGLCIPLFALASFIIHSYFLQRLKSIAVLWQCIGLLGIAGGLLLLLAADFLEYLLSGHGIVRYIIVLLIKFWWLCVVFLGSLAAINFIYGVIIQLSLVEYSRMNNKIKLP